MSRGNMDLRSLRYLVVLSRHLNYTKAAEELGIGQPALSRSIQAIERRMNTRLFDRDRGGVHLTRIGRNLTARGEALLREADELDRMLERSSKADEGEVAFGVGHVPAESLLSRFLKNMFTDHPKLLLNIAVRSPMALLDLLLAEKIDFFICAEGLIPETAPVRRAVLGSVATAFIVRPGHPLLTYKARAPRKKQNLIFPLIASTAPISIELLPAYMRPYLSHEIHIIENYSLLASITEHSDAIWLASTLLVGEARVGRLKEIEPPSGHKRECFRIMMYSLDRRMLSATSLLLQRQFQSMIHDLDME